MLAVFRADASPLIGGGHMVRCLALAEALRGAGWRCAMATRGASAPGFANPATGGLDVLDLAATPAEEEPQAIARRWPEGADLLVVDHYRRDQVFESGLRGWAATILALDDAPGRAHDCDLLLDPGGADQEAGYAAFVPARCRLLLGPSYALLRRQFVAARAGALRRRREPAAVRRALIGFGLADADSLITSALQALAAAGPAGCAIDVVVPRSRKRPVPAREKALDVRVHDSVADMAALMAAADVAIGAAGGAAWERACLGLPSIAVITADNQRRNAAALTRSGAADTIDADAPELCHRLAERVRTLVTDAAHRQAMSEAAARLCDGRGALRVMLAALPPQTAADGRPVSLRAAEQGDGERLFIWQRDERTRRFARNSHLPTRREHEAWFAASLAMPGRLLTVIEHGQEPAGVLRLDDIDDGTGYEVSIYVAPDKYRLGLASAALGLARRLLPGRNLYAEVLPGNRASRRLFLAAGYRETQPGHYLSRPVVKEAVP